MKNFVVVCLVMIVVLAAPLPICSNSLAQESPFTLAERIGEPNARTFFLFSTAAGNYVFRQDGMGEVTMRTGLRKVLYLKVGTKARIERLYFLEHEGDLLLLYEVTGSGYLLRLDQKKRKARWVSTVNSNFDPPVVKDNHVVFNDGTTVPLN